MKYCNGCKQTKDESEFNRNRRKSDGLQTRCRECGKKYHQQNRESISEHNREYRQQNREAIRERKKKYYQQNREKISEYKKNHYQQNRDAISEYFKEYRQQNREEIQHRKKMYYQKNREAISGYNKEYRQQNCEAKRERDKSYYQQNRDAIIERQREYYQQNRKAVAESSKDYRRKRRHSDIQFATSERLRSRLFKAVRKGCKPGSAVRDLGISIAEFTDYIESLWLPGMTWENWAHDGWHLDHIYPLAKADLTDRAQFLAVANWQNYQPMWGDENIIKNDTVKPEAQALFDRLVKHFQEQLEKEEAA